jgi:hypothetical protein
VTLRAPRYAATGDGSDLCVPLLNWKRDEVGTVTLPGLVFNVPVRRDILHRVVRWQLARRQQVRLDGRGSLPCVEFDLNPNLDLLLLNKGETPQNGLCRRHSNRRWPGRRPLSLGTCAAWV